MVFVNPPFNVAIEGHASGLCAIYHRNFAKASGNKMSKSKFTTFLRQACSLLALKCRRARSQADPGASSSSVTGLDKVFGQHAQ